MEVMLYAVHKKKKKNNEYRNVDRWGSTPFRLFGKTRSKLLLLDSIYFINIYYAQYIP